MGTFVVFLLVSLLVCKLSITINAQFTYLNRDCRYVGVNYTEGSVYEKNLKLLFSNLTSKSSLKFYNSTIGDTTDKVYGLFQCRYDVNLKICNACVNDATQMITKECPLNSEAIVWYDECMLSYANRNIFSTYKTSAGGYIWKLNNVSNYDEFAPVLVNVMNGVIKNASEASLYFLSSLTIWDVNEYLYTLAQCTPIVDTSDCSTCLRSALEKMNQCCFASSGVAVFQPSCQLRYDTARPVWYNHLSSSVSPSAPTIEHPGSEPSRKPSLKSAIMWGIIAGVVVVVLIVIAVVWWRFMCLKKRTNPSNIVPRPSPKASDYVADANSNCSNITESIRKTEIERYDFATLEIATEGFSNENRLGKGGFGFVYKGTLDGKDFAIKRLSITSDQGTKEFKAEALVLAKLQHNNLVKLVGFCAERKEKLLVYEYMSNCSLEGFLFDSQKVHLLVWETRSKIILGIAKGLQYLHEDSRTTTVHRDLKPANILLDDDMNPKIADFGLARLIKVAEKCGMTQDIKGTFGYIAPECINGAYSPKSDVYSFGVMLLEIVSGQNSGRYYNTRLMTLQSYARRLWDEGRPFELRDHTLGNNCSKKDIISCIHIALLCLQEDPQERPKISSIVSHLTSSNCLPALSAPRMSSAQQYVPINDVGSQQSDTYTFYTMSPTR